MVSCKKKNGLKFVIPKLLTHVAYCIQYLSTIYSNEWSPVLEMLL